MAKLSFPLFVSFGADPLGERCSPRPPRGIWKQVKLGLFSVLGLWAGVQQALSNPSTCILTTECDSAGTCGEVSFEIRWLHADPQVIWLNGTRFEAKRLTNGTLLDKVQTAGTGVEIRSKGPMITAQKDRQLVYVLPTNVGSEIVVTRFEMPKRYVEYEAAMGDRSVYRGACEGLF